MHLFVTGASGFIGSAVVPELLAHGHTVTGLVRSDDAAATVTALGADVLRGTIDDLDVVRQGAAASDGVIHLAFRHDVAFSGDFPAAGASDQAAIETLGDALAGTDKPLVIASGVAGLPTGRTATEQDVPDAAGVGGIRGANAALTLALAERGVRSVVLRLAPTVHGEGDHGFIATYVQVARDRGVVGHVGDGTNRWPGVHRLDAAVLFRLAVESAPAGSVLHGVAEEGVPFTAIAEVVGRRLDLPVVSVAPDEAGEHFGWLAGFLAADMPVSSAATQQLLGWTPTHATLLDDLEAGHYT